MKVMRRSVAVLAVAGTLLCYARFSRRRSLKQSAGRSRAASSALATKAGPTLKFEVKEDAFILNGKKVRLVAGECGPFASPASICTLLACFQLHV